MGSDAALLASVRTSMALITFGFIIFEYLQKISDKYLAGELPHIRPGVLDSLSSFLESCCSVSKS